MDQDTGSCTGISTAFSHLEKERIENFNPNCFFCDHDMIVQAAHVVEKTDRTVSSFLDAWDHLFGLY